ncbi:nuclear transport factor 2 family protein [Oxalobacteraceae bacterium OM1]|nr:nuclear transport factor 2 family protein [Oxalobacteraceae bacterium OM1]
MSDSEAQQRLIALTKQYFVKGDAGDPSVLEMFSDQVQVYFPKFGTRTGKAAVLNFVQGLLGNLQSLTHAVESYNYLVVGNTVVVEGTESGVMRDGTSWPVEGRSEGRFCNVFEFDGDLITRVFIYVDPDFTGADEARRYWV